VTTTDDTTAQGTTDHTAAARAGADVLEVAPRLHAKAADERARRRKRMRTQRLVAVAAAGPLFVMGWLVLASPVFDVDAVAVAGTARLSTEQVVQASGVRTGQALATVDLAEVRRRVGSLPEVQSVTVERHWPGTLDVTVVERVPVAAVARPEGHVQLIDRSGVVVTTVTDASEAVGLPALTVPAPGPSTTDPTTRSALAVLAELPPDLRSGTSLVQGVNAQRVVLALGGRSVVWGAPGEAEAKVAVLRVLLAKPGGTIDVSSPGLAVVAKAER
jgi:cell division protein FtsQ